MRTLVTLALLVLSASPVRAQSSDQREAVQEIAAPVETVSPPTSSETTASPQQRSTPAEGAADPGLDAGFWRSVLAGVIVAVVSTLILRLIL